MSADLFTKIDQISINLMFFTMIKAKKKIFSLHGGKLNLNFMLQNSNSIFPPCRLKIFFAGFLEKFAFTFEGPFSTGLFQLGTITPMQLCRVQA